MVDSLDDQSGTTCHWEIKEVEQEGTHSLHIHDDVGQRQQRRIQNERIDRRVKIFFTPLEHSRVEWMMIYCNCIAALKNISTSSKNAQAKWKIKVQIIPRLVPDTNKDGFGWDDLTHPINENNSRRLEFSIHRIDTLTYDTMDFFFCFVFYGGLNSIFGDLF